MKTYANLTDIFINLAMRLYVIFKSTGQKSQWREEIFRVENIAIHYFIRGEDPFCCNYTIIHYCVTISTFVTSHTSHNSMDLSRL